jgi:hypothetical protein
MIEAVSRIDDLLAKSWADNRIVPAARSDDAEFCRRVWLDLAGVAPPIGEARAFLRDTAAGKRETLIDRLLQSPQHANHMAATWSDILLPVDAIAAGQRENIDSLQRWLRDQFIANTPYDYFVASFLTAGGAANRGPAIFYTTRDLEPKKIAAATSRIFLGIQLQCAECHDHPFDRWTQDDFWGYAAFFAQIQRGEENMNVGGLIVDGANGEVTLPDSDEVVSPRYPGASEPPEEDVTNHRRRQLTIWLASRDNDYFARAAVNRVWSQLFGRGFVDPVDAMDKDNLASHPEILNYLTDYFIGHRFNLRTLIATITRSEAYQLSSAFSSDDRPPPESFAVMNVKTLTARQFYDSVKQNVIRQSSGLAGDRTDAQRELFLNRMRASDSSPRDYPHGVMQALGVLNGPEVSRAIHPVQGGLLASLDAPFFDQKDKIDALFLATLSRQPTASESKRLEDFFALADSPETQVQLQSDLLWTLLNTAEATVCP